MPGKRKAAETTQVNFVLDETGSMRIMVDEVIGGFNKYVESLRGGGRYTFSLLKFDSSRLEQVYDAVPLDEVKPLTKQTYVPGAMTPLYDAIAHAIRATEQRGITGKVITVVLTDGLENASREATQESVKALIEAKEKEGWAFVYLGVAPAAWGQEQAFAGTTMASNAVYSSGPKGMRGSLAVAATATASYSMGQDAHGLVSDEQRQRVRRTSTGGSK